MLVVAKGRGGSGHLGAPLQQRLSRRVAAYWGSALLAALRSASICVVVAFAFAGVVGP